MYFTIYTLKLPRSILISSQIMLQYLDISSPSSEIPMPSKIAQGETATQSRAYVPVMVRESNLSNPQLRAWFNYTQEPIAIKLLGTKLYILTDPRHMSEAYRNSSTLSLDFFVRGLLRACGSSGKVLEKIFRHDANSSLSEKGNGKSFIETMHELQFRHGFPGQHLDELSEVSRENLDVVLRPRALIRDSGSTGLYAEEGYRSTTISLSKLCAQTIINANQKAYFGDCLSELDPQLYQTFVNFDALSWQLLYRYPRFLGRKMHASKDHITNVLTRYFAAPAEQRPGAAWVTRMLEEEMRQLGLTNEEMSTLMLLQYWGINTNVWKACFWMLSYILFDPSLLSLIRQETAPAFPNNSDQSPGSLNLAYLDSPTTCPQLHAVWLEVVRLTVSTASVRYITHDTPIGGKILRKGNILVNACRQLHYNPDVFGSDTATFDATRFLKKPHVVRGPNWRPFGGGVSLCPGQFVARRTVLMFVALMLQRFEIGLAFSQPFPGAKRNMPASGVFEPRDDLVLTLRGREGLMPGRKDDL
ncbi:hypothetical protein MMC25_006610 [Agyrium rufum]|nr:hypothetical protein [Agyrium rufum]